MKSWLAVRKSCDLSVAAYSVDVRSRQKHCWQTSIRFQGLNAQIEDSSLAKEVSLYPWWSFITKGFNDGEGR
jgi:hypothetical protein